MQGPIEVQKKRTDRVSMQDGGMSGPPSLLPPGHQKVSDDGPIRQSRVRVRDSHPEEAAIAREKLPGNAPPKLMVPFCNSQT